MRKWRGGRMAAGVLALAALVGGGCEGMDSVFREDGSGSGYAANDPMAQPEEPRLDSGFGGSSTPGAGSSSSSGRNVRISTRDSEVYVVRMLPGPAWESGTPTASQPGYDRHQDTLRRWSAQGIVLLGGPVVSDQGTMVIIRAGSLDEARELAESDPAVSSGLFVAEVDELAAQYPGRN